MEGSLARQETVLSSVGDMKGPFRGWLQYELRDAPYFNDRREVAKRPARGRSNGLAGARVVGFRH